MHAKGNVLVLQLVGGETHTLRVRKALQGLALIRTGVRIRTDRELPADGWAHAYEVGSGVT